MYAWNLQQFTEKSATLIIVRQSAFPWSFSSSYTGWWRASIRQGALPVKYTHAPSVLSAWIILRSGFCLSSSCDLRPPWRWGTPTSEISLSFTRASIFPRLVCITANQSFITSKVVFEKKTTKNHSVLVSKFSKNNNNGGCLLLFLYRSWFCLFRGQLFDIKVLKSLKKFHFEKLALSFSHTYYNFFNNMQCCTLILKV